VLEVIEHARKITGKEIVAENTDRRPGDPPVLIASNEKAVKKLGWKPQYAGLDDIIGTAWRWHQTL
jgi:UDP-glucose 4-epimerase